MEHIELNGLSDLDSVSNVINTWTYGFFFFKMSLEYLLFDLLAFLLSFLISILTGKSVGAPLAFKCIKSNGGPVPLTLFGVTRIYPVLYKER